MVSARIRCAIRTARPAGVLARWCSSRIWPFRLAKTLSITSRVEASARSRPSVGGGAGLVGREQRRAVGGEPFAVAAAPEAFVGDHDLGRGAGEQVGERLVLLLVRGHDRVAERQCRARRSSSTSRTPQTKRCCDFAIAVAGEAGELASLLAAGIVGDRELACRRLSRTPPASSQRASCCCTIEINSTRPRSRRLYCDCSGRCGNQPGSTRPTRPRNCRSELIPIAACADRERDQLRVAHQRPAGRHEQGPGTRRRRRTLQRQGLPDPSSRAPISRGHRSGSPSSSREQVPADPPDFHIKPLIWSKASRGEARSSGCPLGLEQRTVRSSDGGSD